MSNTNENNISHHPCIIVFLIIAALALSIFGGYTILWYEYKDD